MYGMHGGEMEWMLLRYDLYEDSGDMSFSISFLRFWSFAGTSLNVWPSLAMHALLSPAITDISVE